MRELPEDLTNSLKSFKGSVYGRNGGRMLKEVDLEKGEAHGQSDSMNEDETAAEPDENSDASVRKVDQVMKGGNGVLNHKSPTQSKNSRKRGARQATSSENNNRKAKDSGPKDMSVFHAPPVKDPDPAADRLADDESPLSDDDFHQLMGMRKPTGVEEQREEEKHPFKLATKHGLYRTICEELRYIQTKYRIFDVMTYVFLALQIIIGAIFIVLGALRDPRTYLAIAILGAISTAVSGTLALMKGQGLPNRLRQARDQMRNVVFETEELYWDFRSGRPIIYSDIKKIREDYLRVLEEMRKNHPDTWTNAASQAMQPQRGSKGRK